MPLSTIFQLYCGGFIGIDLIWRSDQMFFEYKNYTPKLYDRKPRLNGG